MRQTAPSGWETVSGRPARSGMQPSGCLSTSALWPWHPSVCFHITPAWAPSCAGGDAPPCSESLCMMRSNYAPIVLAYYKHAYSFALWKCGVESWTCGQLSSQWRWLSRIWMQRGASTSAATPMCWRMAARCDSPVAHACYGRFGDP